MTPPLHRSLIVGAPWDGVHGTVIDSLAFFHPDSASARATIDCQVSLQRQTGGNALIGRTLHPLLTAAGFDAVRVAPLPVCVDASRPGWADGFTRQTFIAMVEGIRAAALHHGLSTAPRFDAGLRDLHRTAEADSVFCYTFFKGVGCKPGRS